MRARDAATAPNLGEFFSFSLFLFLFLARALRPRKKKNSTHSLFPSLTPPPPFPPLLPPPHKPKKTGDRVAYVIVRAAKGAKAWEKAEDPVWALDHALPIDAQHYLDHHLAQPLLRIFEPLMKNPRELLQGEHTRSIALSTPTAAAGGIMRFAKVKKTCLGCKAPLPEVPAARAKGDCGGGEGDGSDAGSALCQHCAPRRAEIYSRALGAATALEDAFASLWTQCQRCQG